ncbi:L,D-transpeptidase family protein [Tissierella sp. Yu-01]|uniref:L,D-transpeptidase family protein n=1 Tax=Tissierella sp. Yu-01 TaxID=3035694 RepID=UPI00240DBCF3|nr:L,D-transpeptidase family protein [Tissierella sp. Yu-01]WFA10387.1 L,D-transpeptidase family protein [Tissierella sp. Yu-01]
MKRHRYIVILLILVTLFILIGHFILSNGNLKKRYLNVYFKSKNTSFIIHVEVDNKLLHLIDRESKQVLKKYPVATGKPSSPTPLGTYEIADMGKWGQGFGSRWMGLNVPWGIYGIHGTNKPGSIGFNASAGCIRMRNNDIEDLYERVGVGTIVVITNGYYGPFGYGYRDLIPGDRGADVLEVQKRLASIGYYEGTLDGIYGETMKKGLIDYLNDNNIPLTDKVSKDIYESLGIILME